LSKDVHQQILLILGADKPQADRQDLLVYILAQGQRYEVANYPNVTIPTNVNVEDAVRNDFAGFYNALFERTLDVNPGAVVTEYAWDASTCDPCPGPTLDSSDITTLGGDVALNGEPNSQWGRGWVLTRLHARYGADDVGEDLVFREAEAIAGGREFITDDGELEEGSVPWEFNNFQGRYAIRHAWDGPVTCDNPQYGRWGGPPGNEGDIGNPQSAESPNTTGEDYRGMDAALEQLVAEPVPEIGVIPGQPLPPPDGNGGFETPGSEQGGGSNSSSSGCAALTGGSALPIGVLVLMALGWARVVSRRRL
ncbi:MAG: hypothetical protein AAFS10_16545, partial [Myxococcota bacterium]